MGSAILAGKAHARVVAWTVLGGVVAPIALEVWAEETIVAVVFL